MSTEFFPNKTEGINGKEPFVFTGESFYSQAISQSSAISTLNAGVNPYLQTVNSQILPINLASSVYQASTPDIFNTAGYLLDIYSGDSNVLKSYSLIKNYEVKYELSSEKLFNDWQKGTLEIRNTEINDWLNTYLQVRNFIHEAK